MRIDAWLLKLFQKISDWFQMNLGIDNFFLAKAFLGISTLSAIVAAVFALAVLKEYLDTLLRAFFAVWTIFVFMHIRAIELLCKTNPAFANPTVERNLTIRVALCMLMAAMTIEGYLLLLRDTESKEVISFGLFYILGLAYLVSLYFLSCKPKIRKKSKLKKIIERLSGLFTPVPRLSHA